MITIWVPKRLVEIDLYNVAALSAQQLADSCEQQYRGRIRYAAEKILAANARIVMLTGPSASGKTTAAHKLCEEIQRQGHPALVMSLDNFFTGVENYPLLPDGSRDYECLETLDLPLVNQCLGELCREGRTVMPVYDFVNERRADRTETVELQGGVCIVEGIHALNPALTGMVPREHLYRVYAGLREEYCRRGRRLISTRDIRLCRRVLRDAAQRGHSPERTLAMWEQVLNSEMWHIKCFKNTADFLLDTSSTYELGVIAGLLGKASRMLAPDSRYCELWDETARRFENVAPLGASLLPPDSMLWEFYS